MTAKVRPALDGILVVALEQAVAAPLCTRRLVEAGARVIKIERPGGDFARHYDGVVHGESAYFVWLNHGKQSIVLDLQNAADAAVLEAMLARADIFVQNLGPGAAARLGFGSLALRERYPRLITCDISGYGEAGPESHLKAYDLLVQCETGLAAVTGGSEGPARVGVSVADIGCGTNAHAAILQALYSRALTGVGQGVAVSLFDTLADWMAVPLLYQDYAGQAPGRMGLRHPTIAPYGAFDCADGRMIVIAIQNEREWQGLCTIGLGRPDLACDPRFLRNDLRVANRRALDAVLGAIFASLTHDEARHLLRDAKVAFASVNDVADLSVHPHLRRMTVGTPTGAVAMPASPVRWSLGSTTGGSVPSLDVDGAALREEFA
ncbi:MAG: carnitine dehydratase [Bradyrhizobium sp.]|nr:carnitine dehydratase [Bradyrhizobium sp.]